jgi:hypothetical protein
MRRRPRPKRKGTVPEVKAHFSGHEKAGRNDFDLWNQGFAKKPTEFIDVILAVRSKRSRQILVPGKSNARFLEGSVPKNVIGVHVRVNDVAHGLIRHGPDGLREAPTFANAASRINHRGRIVAHDKTDIRNRAVIGAGHERDRALEDIDAWGDLFDRKGGLGSRSVTKRCKKKERQSAESACDLIYYCDRHLDPV